MYSKGRHALSDGFSADFASDSLSILINERAARLFGWEEPLDKQVRSAFEDRVFTIIGVLKDFHIAFLTVSYQSIKAATANPVDTLRSE